jgi:hypothetical protein
MKRESLLQVVGGILGSRRLKLMWAPIAVFKGLFLGVNVHDPDSL